jgi:hypothetical protein
MSFKSKVLAAAATLTMVGGVGTMGVLTAGSAGAATPSCGPACINIFSRDFGTHRTPNFTVDVLRQGSKVNQPVILFKTSNSDPALDWSLSFQGLTSDFCAAGIVSGLTCLHYGGAGHFPFSGAICPTTGAAPVSGLCPYPDFPAWEVEYAPFGVNSGLCMGVAATASQNEGVSLQPCGVSGKTVWIGDSLDNPFSSYVPAINGSNTNFSHPFVLTYPNNGYPTDKPRPQLQVRNLTGFTQPGGFSVISSVSSNQLWSANFGVLK